MACRIYTESGSPEAPQYSGMMTVRRRDVGAMPAQGAGWAVGARAAAILVQAAIVPFSIRALGVEAYAWYAAVYGLVGYATVLDVGAGTAVGHLVGSATERGARGRAALASLLSMVVAAAAVLAGLWVAAPAVTRLFAGAGSVGMDTGTTVVRLLGVRIVAQGISTVLDWCLIATVGPSVRSKTFVASSAFHLVCVLTIVALGELTIVWLAAIELVRWALNGVLNTAGLLTSGYFSFSWSERPDRSDFGAFWSIGGRMQFVGFARVINLQTDVVALGIFATPASVVAYDVANRLAQVVRQLPLSYVEATFVQIVSSIRRKDMAAAGRWTRATTLVVAGATAVLATGVLANAASLTTLVAGQPLPPSVQLLWVLVLSYWMLNVSAGATGYWRAAGVPRPEMRAATASVLLNVLLSVVGGYTVGLWGVVSGTVAAALASSWLMVRSLKHSALDGQVYPVPPATWVRLVSCSMLSILTAGLLSRAWDSYYVILGTGPLAFAVWIVCIRQMGVFASLPRGALPPHAESLITKQRVEST